MIANSMCLLVFFAARYTSHLYICVENYIYVRYQEKFMLFWIHPAVQVLAFILASYTLFLGWSRVRFLHFDIKCPFCWQLHVRMGRWAIALWLLGSLLGFGIAFFAWGSIFVTGSHAWVGLLFLPLAIFGYISGHILDKVKKRRFWLPVLHGANNMLLLALALWQAVSGYAFLPL